MADSMLWSAFGKFFRIRARGMGSVQERRLWDTLFFLLRLLALSIPLYVILSLSEVSGLLVPLQHLVASHAELVFRVFGINAVRDGMMFTISDGFRFYIGEDCTGWKSMLFFASLVVAVPGIAWRKRLWGIVIGVPIVYLGNLFRILLVVLIEMNMGVEAAFAFHDLLWNAGLISLVIALWVLWLYFSGYFGMKGGCFHNQWKILRNQFNWNNKTKKMKRKSGRKRTR